MTRPFKFNMGQAVVLVTSVATIIEQMAEEQRDKEAENFLSTFAPRMLRAWGPIEKGDVIGRLERITGEHQFLVRYRAGDGRQTEGWFDEDAIALNPRDYDKSPDPEFEEVDQPAKADQDGDGLPSESTKIPRIKPEDKVSLYPAPPTSDPAPVHEIYYVREVTVGDQKVEHRITIPLN
jgi:hypothetical protein